jgi:hypothetical protein
MMANHIAGARKRWLLEIGEPQEHIAELVEAIHDMAGEFWPDPEKGETS